MDVKSILPWLTAFCFGAILFFVGKYQQKRERNKTVERAERRAGATVAQGTPSLNSIAGISPETSPALASSQSQMSDPGKDFGFAGGAQGK